MVLSQYEVIGPEEAGFIRDFVDNGGMLIADVRPGIYGARGKRRQGGVLDDLFGVRHTGTAPVTSSPGSIMGSMGRSTLALTRSKLYVNPRIEVTTGMAMGQAGDTPICIVRNVGMGRTVLLNFTMWSYPKLAVHNGVEDAVGFFRTLFARSRCQNSLRPGHR